MRKAGKIVLWSAAAVIAVLIAVVGIFLITFNPNDYRAWVEDKVSDAIGRDVWINGDLTLAFSLTPTLTVDDVSIGNPAWASRPTMASVDRLAVTVQIMPLLHGELRIDSIRLSGVDVVLERDTDGTGNWEFDFLTKPNAATRSRERVDINEVELRRISARYVDAQGATVSAELARLTLTRSLSGQVLIELDGALEGLPLNITWNAGPLGGEGGNSDLRWPVAASLRLGSTTATLRGRLRAPLDYTHSAFDLDIAGRAEDLLAILGLPHGGAATYMLAGQVRVDADSIELSDLKGRIVDGGLVDGAVIEAGRVSVRRGERVEAALSGKISGEAFSASGRLGRLTDVFGAAEPWPLDVVLSLGPARLSVSGNVAKTTTGMRADVGIDLAGNLFDAMKPFTSAPLPSVGVVGLAGNLTLERKQASLTDLRFRIGETTVTGELKWSNLLSKPGLDAKLAVDRLDLARLAPAGAADSSVLDRELSAEWLERLDATATLELGRLEGAPIDARNVTATMRLADGELRLEALGGRVAGVQLNGSASVRRSSEGLALDADLFAPRVAVEPLLKALAAGDESGMAGIADGVSLRLETRGTTIRSAIARSDFALLASPVELRLSEDTRSVAATAKTLRIGAAANGPVSLTMSGRIDASLTRLSFSEPFELSLSGGTVGQIVSSRAPRPPIEFDLESRYGGSPIHVRGRVDDTRALLNLERTPIELHGIWGNLQASVTGAIVPSPRLLGTVVDLDLKTADLRAAAEQLEIAGWPSGPASLATRLAIVDDTFGLTDTRISAPGIEGTGQVTLGVGERRAVQGVLRFTTLDFTRYQVGPGAPEEKGSDGGRALYHAYTTNPLPLERLRALKTDIHVWTDLFRFGEFVSKDASLNIGSDHGLFAIDAALDGGRLRSHIELDAGAADADLRLRLTGDSIPLAEDQAGDLAPGTPMVDLDLTLHGYGSSSLELAQSLDGHMLLYLHGGRIEKGGLRFLFGPLLYQLFDVINPFTDRQSDFDIECAGGYFDVTGGVASTEKGIVMQTPGLQVVGVGTVNLANGALEMAFRTKQRKGLLPSLGGIVNQFVELTGKIDAPRIQVSPERAATSGTLAVATGGLSLIATSLFGRMTARDACPDLVSMIGAPGSAP
jgi:uncharacterized protein involved in outer membrane biogenesis